MTTLQMVRFQTDLALTAEVEQAIADLFTAVEDAAPSGLEYTALRVGDSAEFIITLTLCDSTVNPLLAIDAATRFRERLAGWAGGPVAPQPVSILGHYAR